jgi:hypothetical protein
VTAASAAYLAAGIAAFCIGERVAKTSGIPRPLLIRG